jgi:hypothetical protein
MFAARQIEWPKLTAVDSASQVRLTSKLAFLSTAGIPDGIPSAVISDIPRFL